jgi:phosphatidylserine/phosphatidylglycerophosphate/cardiolipin synthase-like enzyme
MTTMNSGHELISKAACKLAAELPLSTLQIVVRFIEESSSLAVAKNGMVEVPQPHHRQLAADFIEQCMTVVPDATPNAVAMALLTAGLGEKIHRNEQAVELVWTGPDAGVVPFRRTEQAILQVLDSAQHRITLVSYAVYKVPNVCEALIRAARRGVKINVILETPDRLEGQNEYSTLHSLGQEVAAGSSVFYWPQEKRQHHGDKPGILHVKCAVADGRWLFLSSANLTEYAFSINMELGVLVTGGSLPGRVEENFDRLIGMGMMESV